MDRKELCVVYNFSQKYREGIYKLIEQHYECHWVFGHNKTDIKGLDDGMLKDVQYVDNVQVAGPIYYQTNVLALLNRYNSFLMLGELFNITAWLMLIFKKLFFRKKQIYLWSHGWYGREGVLKRILKKRFFGLSDGVFLYGDYAKDIAYKQGYTKTNLYVIHNSLGYDKQLQLRKGLTKSDIYKLHFGNDNPVLLFVGRLTKVKNLSLLVKAIALLKDKGLRYNLVFVGDGEERQHLEELIKTYKITSQVWFYGSSYSEEQNAPLIYNADLCVSPGNVGLTAIHSMTYGTPVLTHNDFSYQMPEFEAIRSMSTGVFFKRNDLEAMTKAIEDWFKMPLYDREQIRKACYDEIDNRWTPQFQINIITNIIK